VGVYESLTPPYIKTSRDTYTRIPFLFIMPPFYVAILERQARYVLELPVHTV
jgi:hypothetical protein